jgi:BON domain
MLNQSSWSLIGSIGAGAALMYLLDPNSGRRRRALLRDRAVHAAHKTADSAAALSRDLRNRAIGLMAGMRARFEADGAPVDDAVIEARVRSALGRVTTHPGAIGVSSSAGFVTLTGPVLASEHDAVYRAVSGVPGVCDVIDNLSAHEQAGDVPGLQGGGYRRWLQNGWSPTTRALATAGGVGLLAYGAMKMSRSN